MDEQSTSLKRLPRLKPRGGVQVMYASIRALFLRELQTRFGQYRLGYFWILLEPALHIGFMLILFGSLGRTVLGMDFEVFLVNGILPFFMFRQISTQALNAVSANKGLFSYRPVKPIDTLLARSFLELFLHFAAYIFFMVILLWFGLPMSIDAIPQLLGYWGILFVLTLGLGLIFLVIGDISPEINKFIVTFFFILYLFSGVIYTIHIIPPAYQPYLLWNPLVHILELMRHAVAPTYPLAIGVSLSYVFVWILGAFFLGLLLYARFEQKMVKSK
ncbi:ABC transporter permease [Acinetobacter sp. VNK23]|uniref:ABC transporter permease n=1 Tax=Acinetobacter thutiue TaxID=2998078 RepID=UPI002577E975|nr:ABC transporter permease [Acinetobacter thutiue]MDM1022214.1 ABC transporter permease [Acinetobacter thutiue]